MREKPNNCQGCGVALPKSWAWCRDCEPKCVDCGESTKRQRIRCRSCGNTLRWSRPEEREKQAAAIKRLWDTDEGREKYTEAIREFQADPGYRKLKGDISKGMWDGPGFRERHAVIMAEAREAPSFHDNMSAGSRRVWEDPEHRRQQSESRKRVWADPERREQQRERQREYWAGPEKRRQRSLIVTELHSTPEYQEVYRAGLETRHVPSGPEHYNWKGGCKPWYGEYPVEFDEALRLQIRERDGFTCQLRYEPENGRAHDVHHIDMDKQNSGPDNLITLCRSCHIGLAHGPGEHYYRIGFEALVGHS